MHLHQVEVAPTDRENVWVGHLGPDVLGEGFDPVAAADRLVAADRPLVEALLDQRLVSGMGTIWAAELAAVAGVDPRTATRAVPGLAAALAAISREMARAVTEPVGARRRSRRVFERTGQPCRTCGTPIRSVLVGTAPTQRPTYWCPRCQPPG